MTNLTRDPFQLQTLGALRLGPHRETKPLLLLAYLLIHGPATRDDLCALLWPHAQEPGNNLRVALSTLRRWGVAITTRGPLCAAHHPCDALTDARDRAARPFLHSVPLERISDRFETWVYDQRERLARETQVHQVRLAERRPHTRETHLSRAWTLTHAPPPDAALLGDLLNLCPDRAPLLGAASEELRDLAPDWPVLAAPRPVRAALAWWLADLEPWAVTHQTTLDRLSEILRGSGLTVLHADGGQTQDLDRDLAAQVSSAGGATVTVILRHLADQPEPGRVLAGLRARYPQLRVILTGRLPAGTRTLRPPLASVCRWVATTADRSSRSPRAVLSLGRTPRAARARGQPPASRRPARRPVPGEP